MIPVNILIERPIPSEKLEKILIRFPDLPLKERGIVINAELIKIAIELLNDSPDHILPQNCRNDIMERTPDGLDKRIKGKTGSNLRTANIVSDILRDAGIVEICKMKNFYSDREVKATRLLTEWQW